MFTTTLIAAPGSGALETSLVETLASAWGGSAARWLSRGEAAEFDMPACPDNRWTVWEDMQALGIDLVVHPSEGRRKMMLLADMDSTMIQQECIDELAAVAGVGTQVKEITARAMNGELDFDGALIERVRLLKGLPETVIRDVLATRITLMPGGPALLATMKAHGAYAALVSGGFTAFTARVAATLGFDENRANTLLVESGTLSGEVGRPILGREAKVTALEEITARLGITDADVLAVGDVLFGIDADFGERIEAGRPIGRGWLKAQDFMTNAGKPAAGLGEVLAFDIQTENAFAPTEQG